MTDRFHIVTDQPGVGGWGWRVNCPLLRILHFEPRGSYFLSRFYAQYATWILRLSCICRKRCHASIVVVVNFQRGLARPSFIFLFVGKSFINAILIRKARVFLAFCILRECLLTRGSPNDCPYSVLASPNNRAYCDLASYQHPASWETRLVRPHLVRTHPVRTQACCEDSSRLFLPISDSVWIFFFLQNIQK